MTFDMVLVTNGHRHGMRILDGLMAHGVKLSAVVLLTNDSLRQYLRHTDTRLQKVADLPRATFSWLGRHGAARTLARQYRPYASQVVITGALNSARMKQDLLALDPDFLILGGIGILSAELIHTARVAAINTHPGLLPWIRGTGVVGRALQRRIPNGATLHYVNPLIDGGTIIERRLLPVTGAKQTLRELEEATNALAAQMMVDIVVEQLSAGKIPEGRAQEVYYPVCRTLSAAERVEVDAMVASGVARELFEQWRGYCVGGDRCQLPQDFDGSN